MMPAAAPDPWHKSPWFSIVLGPVLAALLAGLLLQYWSSTAPKLVASYELHDFRLPAAYSLPIVPDAAVAQRDDVIAVLRGRLAWHSTQASYDSLPVALRLDLPPLAAVAAPGQSWYPAQYFDQVALVRITNKGNKAVEHYRIQPGHLVYYRFQDAADTYHTGYTKNSLQLGELAPGESQYVVLWIPRASLLPVASASQVLRYLKVVWPDGEATAQRAERVTGFWAWAKRSNLSAFAVILLLLTPALGYYLFLRAKNLF